MDIDEMKVYAAEHVLNELCAPSQGSIYPGLGGIGRYLVRATAQSAHENASHLGKVETPAGGFEAMQTAAVQDFVLGILGMGEFIDERGLTVHHRTPTQAAQELVSTVWHAYIGWARPAK